MIIKKNQCCIICGAKTKTLIAGLPVCTSASTVMVAYNWRGVYERHESIT